MVKLQFSITNVTKLTSENAFSRIIYILMEKQIIFLPIFSPKFGLQIHIIWQKIILNTEFAWAMDIIQKLKLWILVKIWTGFRSFGLRQVFQNIYVDFKRF